jgi:hypothetical protein
MRGLEVTVVLGRSAGWRLLVLRCGNAAVAAQYLAYV